jgi:cytochrome c peroxidase
MVKKAFGTDSVQSVHYVRALAQYMRTLVSTGSGADAGHLSQLELVGQVAFSQICASCHTPPFYTDFEYYALGEKLKKPFVPIQNLANGRYRISLQNRDLGAFKTASLRNVARTAPYMHDGSLPNLAACLHHGSRSLSELAKANKLSPNQMQAALVLYLEALSDSL